MTGHSKSTDAQVGTVVAFLGMALLVVVLASLLVQSVNARHTAYRDGSYRGAMDLCQEIGGQWIADGCKVALKGD